MKRWCARCAVVFLGVGASAASHAGEVVLQNRQVRIALDEGRGFALSQIQDVGTGKAFLKPDGSPLWELLWRAKDGRELRVLADARAKRTCRATSRRVVLVWSELTVGEGTARVEVSGTLDADSPLSRWRLSVEWTDRSLTLWQADFPRVGGIARQSAQDMLTIPAYWGRYCSDPVARLRNYKLSYPCSGSMQFWTFVTGSAGLYLGTYDSECWLKYWQWTADAKAGTGMWRAIHLPPVPTPKPRRYDVPYPVVLGTFTGDWHSGAALYRQWAIRQPWCREGPIAKRKSITGHFKRSALWLKYYSEPGKVLGELCDHQQYLRVPISVHYYRYPIAAFDDNYPEMLPAKPGFIQGVRDMQALGAYVLPYTQGSIWDMDTESWRREHGAAAAAKREDGSFYLWQIRDNAYAWMCPGARAWHEKVFDFVSKLTWDHGVDGVYLDVLSSGRARPCYDTGHGHPTHGGTSWGAGNRELLGSLRRRIRARKPHASFTTESNCEIYIDKIDAFLTLDVTRGGYRPPVMLLPLFTAVYHDYTIQYGSDCRLSQPTADFCALLAEHFAWGAKLTLSEAPVPPIASKPESAAYLRELTRCYDSVGRPWLLEGQWLRPPSLDVPSEVVPVVRRAKTDVTMPVVRHSLWRAPDGSLGLVLTNWTAKPQRVDAALRLADYGLEGEWHWQQLWPPTQAAPRRVGGQVRCALELPPRSARLFALVRKPQPVASLARYEGDFPFLVLRRKDGAWPTTQVKPGTQWHAQDATVAIDAAGTLTVKGVPSANDFLLVRKGAAPKTAARLKVVAGPRARALPYEPLPFEVVLESHTAEAVAWREAKVELHANRRGGMARLDGVRGPARGALGGPGQTAVVRKGSLLVADRDLAEHAVTLRAQVRVQVGGKVSTLTDEVRVPVDMPLLVALTRRSCTLVAGRTTEAKLWVRNVAPQPMRVKTVCKPPAGWSASPAAGVEMVVPAAGDEPGVAYPALRLTAAPTAKAGTVVVPFHTTCNGHAKGTVVDLLACHVLPRLLPLDAGSGPFEPAVKPSRIRRDGRAMLFLRKGEKVAITLTNVRVTTYTNTLCYRVLDPDLREVAKGSLAVDKARTIRFAAKTEGVHFVDLEPANGSCTIATPHKWLVHEASKGQPMKVIFQNPPLYLHVPTNAKGFVLAVECGGATEPAVVKIVDPAGRVVAAASGALMGRRFVVKPTAAQRGKVWKLIVDPREDVSFYLEGDVMPYLADHPGRLLIAK